MSSQSASLLKIESEKVKKCVQYLLMHHQKKFPIKRADLVKNVTKSGAQFKEVIDAAVDVFKNIYGMKLVEVPDKAQYILVNNLTSNELKEVEKSDTEKIISALLIPVLIVIFMNNNELNEEDLWKFLKQLGFEESTRVEGLGKMTVKDLLTLWTRQLYLKKEKVSFSEQLKYCYKWGFRAEAEVDKLELLKLVCDIYGDNTTPQTFRQQYRVAMEETGN